MLADPRLAAALDRCGRSAVKAAINRAQDEVRAGRIPPEQTVSAALDALPRPPREVVNATGVLLHTNLGRAALAPAAVGALTAASGPTDVEFDLATGRRARRGRGALQALAAAVPRAEDVHVVNNNAAALALAAMALAPGREIVVGRGELVEIGDGFRLPELLEAAGARLREVGTTNRTRGADYAGALGEETALILKVHPSNYRITGFTSEATIAELAGLGPPVLADIGSGLLRPEPALPEEPDADTALAQGAALVTASGDKLLGGPQAGLIFGRTELVQRLRRHPLARAMRADKLTLAALDAGVRTPEQTLVTRQLHTAPESLQHRAQEIARSLDAAYVEVVDSTATVGGGAAPGVSLPSTALALPAELAAPLRLGETPVVGRIESGRLLLDLRSVPPESDGTLTEALRKVVPLCM